MNLHILLVVLVSINVIFATLNLILDSNKRVAWFCALCGWVVAFLGVTSH